MHGTRTIVLGLFESGADLEVRDAQNATPLMVAVFSNDVEGARILLEHGAPVRHGADLELRSGGGQTPLWWNAALANVGAVQRLSAAGADVNARDDRGMSPLEAALLNRERRPPEQIAAGVELLRDAGAR